MKKSQQKLLKRRLCLAARTVAGVSFLALVMIGVSSLVQAMSLEQIENEDGVPSIWQAASLSEPDTITLPITYWDQKADPCDDPDRQFEWATCNSYRTHGVLMGMVKPQLGADRLPVPAFSDSESAWAAQHDALSLNVIGHDPVQKTDNFYRWFHEVPGLSKRINGRTVTFNRTASGTYVYGGQHIYPIDDVPGLDEDDVQLLGALGNLHNFNFTAHLGFGIKVNASGKELFQFSGDDDVWVFLNNKLVLDIGGLHGPISGWFQINEDGTVSTFVEKVNDLSIRSGDWVDCMRIKDGVYADETCISTYGTKIRENFYNYTVKNADFGLKEGDVVNIDFFYAERSTDGSNTKITINHMNWPIAADCDITAKVLGKLEGTENRLVEFNTYVKNRDPENPLDLERLAAYITETTAEGTQTGYLPLDKTTLWYTTTPEDESSWQLIDISAPENSTDGFKLANPITMAPAGQPGDTLYFRYYGETSDQAGSMSSTVSYYTTMSGNAGVTYDSDAVDYDEDQPVTPTPDPNPNPDPEPTPDPNPTPGPDPTPETPDPTPNPENPGNNLPNIPTIDDDLVYLGPLGEVAFVPNTGIISDSVKKLLGDNFTEVILSQAFVMVTLLIFAGSFAMYFSLRKNLTLPAARLATKDSKAMPKQPSSKMTKSKTAKLSPKTTQAKSLTKSLAKSKSASTTTTNPKPTSKSPAKQKSAVKTSQKTPAKSTPKKK